MAQQIQYMRKMDEIYISEENQECDGKKETHCKSRLQKTCYLFVFGL